MMNSPFNLIITGGKTGGHLFPGIATAEAVRQINPGAEILFVGTDAPFEVQTLQKYGFAHKSIYSKPIKGKNLFGKLFSMSIILVSLIQSLILMKAVKPDFVLGVGGFSSFAVVVAAWILGVPRAIQEQNAFPGLTNRKLARFADIIFTSFENTRGWTGHPKVKYVGNPVRKALVQESETGLETEDPRPDQTFLLVTGGSQGATSINTAFMDALALMDGRDKLYIVHQTGIQDEAVTRQKYADLKIRARVGAFFHDLPQIQKRARLAVTRAGAGIISELCVRGLPAILIPFPHAADDHQTFNAKALEEQGAAVLIKEKDLDGNTLKQAIESLITDKNRLDLMSEKLRGLAKPDAAKTIADHLLNFKRIRG
ncbi:MAG: undecaprenyldiphospho-muramoylpentapeptide beta-N-acetylglucosaminyltransferase [Desulfobacula sp.]|nr:undecaprenyldiphospho-muramoylpentapeptide beta-N-acetylglucosaminyltransferase [Desulfobacula sp.]MDA8134290.1 undecaprenyldiphospho-muramoylpentapeptide beta-N-acetylglucosaminyltransferase [Desulfobacteraceae bacterium]